MSIVIIGGTGNLGYGLALRLVNAGYKVIVGSRSKERALATAEKIKEITRKYSINGMENSIAVKEGDLVVLSVPNAGRRIILTELKPFLQGKTILDVTVPMAFNPLRYAPPKDGSNAKETKRICGDKVSVLAGLHTVSADLLNSLEKNISNLDVLIAGDNNKAKEKVIEIFSDLGMRAFDSGGLEQAATLEGLTVMIIGMNKRYKRKHIGIKLFGI